MLLFLDDKLEDLKAAKKKIVSVHLSTVFGCSELMLSHCSGVPTFNFLSFFWFVLLYVVFLLNF